METLAPLLGLDADSATDVTVDPLVNNQAVAGALTDTCNANEALLDAGTVFANVIVPCLIQQAEQMRGDRCMVGQTRFGEPGCPAGEAAGHGISQYRPQTGLSP